jgi:hypothetical protein
VICEGCEQEIAAGEDGRIWCDAPLGMCTLVVHKTQECGRAALAKHPDYTMRKGNRPPLSKKERAKLDA